jgi:hypothetical protein
MISFISWVNNEEVYKGLVCSAVCEGVEFVKVGQEADSLAKAYNIGTSQAKGDVLVYVHQDVRIEGAQLFKTTIEKALEDKAIGFAGPIGNIDVNVGSWWTVGPGLCRGYVRQFTNILSFGEYNGRARQLDGLMLCTKKRFKFPEELPKLHFLDLWMCMLAEECGFYNWIFSGVVIQHLSGGERDSDHYNKNWAQYRARFFPGR